MAGIDVTGVSKSFGAQPVLDRINFNCRPGQITGLLGPNGSGKTTIMRLMTGLSPLQTGTVTFDGIAYHRLRDPAQLVGTLLDPTAHHPGRSVRQTLRHIGTLIGVDRRRVDEVIEIMGLGSVIKRKMRALSLGMRQRVGLAIAFLGRPQYLILDEPVNGLDAETINWVREVLQHFTRNERGTVLLSSHLLTELEAYIDHVVIISRGRVVVDRPMSMVGRRNQVEVVTDEPDRLAALLEQHQLVTKFVGDNRRLSVTADSRSVAKIALDNRILVTELVGGKGHSLEQVYLDATSGEFAASSKELPI